MSDDDEKPDINAVIDHLGGRTKDRGSYMTTCLLHDDKTPSMSVNKSKNVWKCHSCGEKGDSYTLIELVKGVDFAGARDIAKGLGLDTGTSAGEELTGSIYGGQRRKADPKRKQGGSYTPAWRRAQ